MRNGSRLRNSTALVALVVGMAIAVPSPAHAFLGKIVSDLFGGGSGACSAEDLVAKGALAAATGGASLAVDAATAAANDGDSGCPVVEDKPLAIQKMTEEQRDELIKQGEELVRMNASTTADLSGDIVGGVLTGGDQAMAVGLEWSPDAADARYAEQYPESYEGMMPDQMAAHGDMQAKEARDAARTSKRTTAAAVADMIKNVPTELDTLNAELRACEGVNCSIQVMAQIVGLSVKVGVLNAVMDASHYRANESLSDTLFAAREQAIQDRRLNNGEVGSMPISTTPDEPEPAPDEPPEVIFDPSTPVS